MSRRLQRSRVTWVAPVLATLVTLAACDTSGAPSLPAPVSVPSAVPGAPAGDGDDDDGTVAPPPAGQDQDDDGPDGPDDDGPDDDN